jgi:hypothetical protein
LGNGRNTHTVREELKVAKVASAVIGPFQSGVAAFLQGSFIRNAQPIVLQHVARNTAPGGWMSDFEDPFAAGTPPKSELDKPG